MRVDCLYFLLLPIFGIQPKLYPNNNKQSNVITTKCINEIIKKHRHQTANIQFINTNIHFEIDAVRYLLKDAKTRIQLDEKNPQIADFYIIEPQTNFDKLHKDLSNTNSYNPRANFIVILDDNSNGSKVFETGRAYYLTNLVTVSRTGIVEILGEGSKIVAESCNSDSIFLARSDNFNRRNIKLKLCFLYDMPPYSMFYGGRVKQLMGIEYELVGILQEKLQFQIELASFNFDSWGNKKKIYSNYLGELKKGKCHLLIGAFHNELTETSTRDFDVTSSIMDDHLYYVVPFQPPIPHYRALFLIFHPRTWLLLALALLLPSLLLPHHLPLQLLLEISSPFVHRHPAPFHRRLLLLHLIFMYYIISTTFKTSMINFLSSEAPSYQLETVDDLRTAKLSVSSFQYVVDYLSRSYRTVNEQKIANEMHYCYQQVNCVNLTAERNAATIVLGRYFDFILAKQFIDGDGRPLIHRMLNNIKQIHLALFLTKGHPLYSQINDIVRRLLAGGFVQLYVERAGYQTKKLLTQKKRLLSTNLTFATIYFVFIMLGIGLLASFVVFCGELAVGWRGRPAHPPFAQ